MVNMKYILFYGFGSIEPKKRLEFNRKLYGYIDYSNNGQYTYFRKGILNPNKYEKLAKSVLLLAKKPRGLISLLKNYNANYRIFKVKD